MEPIIWPAEFDPRRAPIHVRNVLESRASVRAAWAWLVQASVWPSWYPNSHSVVLAGGAAQLGPDVRFRWTTFGVRLWSRVEQFTSETSIAWTARGLGVLAYHAWSIEPRGAGCRIITEATQYGLVARLGDLLMPERMRRGHQLWLDCLDRVAQAGPPVARRSTG